MEKNIFAALFCLYCTRVYLWIVYGSFNLAFEVLTDAQVLSVQPDPARSEVFIINYLEKNKALANAPWKAPEIHGAKQK